MAIEPRDEREAARRAAELGPRLLLTKAALLGALAIAGAFLARIPEVRAWLGPTGHLIPYLDRLGPAAIPVFLFGSALLISIGVPRLVFCPIAGAAFGFWNGLAISTGATMLSYLALFVFVRGRRRDAEFRFQPPRQLAFLRHDPGLGGVIVARLIPVPGLLATIALSLSPVRRGPYLAGSLIGLIPEAVPLVLLGAGLLDGNPRQLAWLGAGALLLILGCYAVMRRLARRFARHSGGG